MCTMSESSGSSVLCEVLRYSAADLGSKLAGLTVLLKMVSQPDVPHKELFLHDDCINLLITTIDQCLTSHEDPACLVATSVAMEIVYKLSKFPIGIIQKLITDSVLKTLLKYSNLQGSFYEYSQSMRQAMSSVCASRHVIGKVSIVPITSDLLDFINNRTQDKLKRYHCIPETLKVCVLYVPGDGEDVNVAQQLINHGLAWQGEFPVAAKEENWKDILVTEIIDGGMFFAQVGENCMKKVLAIQQALNTGSQLSSKQMAKAGDLVAVETSVCGEICYLRAQVVSVNPRSIDVFAVDYGYSLTVPDTCVYSLPVQLSLTSVPRKISLCAVNGIVPPAVDEDIVHNALAIIANLCKQSIHAGEILRDLGGLSQIVQLLEACPSVRVRSQALTVLHNLTNNPRLVQALQQLNCLQTVLGVLRDYVPKEDVGSLFASECAENVLVARCLLCITNLLTRSASNRICFYRNQGLELVLRLLLLVGMRNHLFVMGTKLLKVFVGQSIRLSNDQSEHNSVRSVQTHSSSVASAHLLQMVSEDNTSEEISSGMLEKCSPCLGPCTNSGSSYVLGMQLSVEEDEEHEFYTCSNVSDIKREQLAQHVCGMLNSGYGGTIYFGVSKSKEVFGLTLSRDEKDQFRLGIDQMMCDWIEPVLFHSLYDFLTCPVLHQDTREKIPDMYVIELHVKASRSAQLYMVRGGGCFYRFGNTTSTINIQELRQLVCIDEEQHYREEIQSLVFKRNSLQQ